VALRLAQKIGIKQKTALQDNLIKNQSIAAEVLSTSLCRGNYQIKYDNKKSAGMLKQFKKLLFF
jgi:hypothetical protein